MDLPGSFTIRERDHRIHNPFTDEQLATLGRAIRLRSGMTMLDLASGSGEMLCAWARDHGITGTGSISAPSSSTRAGLAPSNWVLTTG